MTCLVKDRVAAWYGGDESDDETQDELVPTPTLIIDASDIPQAFSHFTHRFTHRRQMVCYMQGVLNRSVAPPVFVMTDPVTHYRSTTGRKNVNCRTNHGMKGMEKYSARIHATTSAEC